jgi:putative membrane protein
MKTYESPKLPDPVLKQNDRSAKILIWSVSVLVFIGIAFLTKVKLNPNIEFDPHIFATINAGINSVVAVLLVAALLAVKSKKFFLHKKLMLAAIILSIFFLISYVCHHLLTGDTKFGDLNHDGILSADEKTLAGTARYVYYFILITHIPLAGIILPFILFTAYRALSGDYEKHKKLARITWPIWFYVAISGVIVYLMIHPYYG